MTNALAEAPVLSIRPTGHRVHLLPAQLRAVVIWRANGSAGGGHRQSAARPMDCAILYRYMASLAFPSHRQYTPFVSHRPSVNSHCILATAHTSLILGVAVLVLQVVAVLALSISSVSPPWTWAVGSSWYRASLLRSFASSFLLSLHIIAFPCYYWHPPYNFGGATPQCLHQYPCLFAGCAATGTQRKTRFRQ